jgi:phage terminase large subunit GpA-like protein
MVADGLWVPRGQTVSRSGRLQGKPERPPRHAGFHLSSLYAETVDFGRIAAEYLESRDSEPALRSFWNNWLGLRWSNQRKAPKWKRIGRRLAGTHRRGTAPAWAIFLTAGIDTQDEAAYWVVRAWGDGCTSWLVDWGKVGVTIDSNGQPVTCSDLDQLDDLVLNRSFPLVQPNPVGKTSLRVRLANIDYQGHRTWDVSQWVRSRQGQGIERLRIIAGDTRVPAGEFYRMSTVEVHAGTGQKYPGGLRRWALDVDTYKEDLQNRYEAPLDKPGAWFVTHDCLDLGEDYLRQICNEARVRARDKRGRQSISWEIVDHRTGNHYWDCEVYARAAADMVTGQDWADLTRRAQGTAANKQKRPRRPSDRSAENPSRPLPYGERR